MKTPQLLLNTMSNNIVKLSLAFCLWLYMPLCCLADEVNTADIPRASKRPAIPTFDEAMVRKMVDAIDAPYNASLLKVGYFTRRGRQPFAIEDGYKILKSTAGLEPEGTRKWYLLKSLMGYAAIRIENIDKAEAFDTYDLIFKTAASTASNISRLGLGPVLHSTINDYVMTMSGRLQSLNLQDDPRAVQTFLAAWRAYITVISIPNVTRLPEPQWAKAIQNASLQSQLEPLIDQALGNPNISKSYSLLKAAAHVYSYSKPYTALLLFKKAQPLLPKEDLNEAARFYTLWVDTQAPEKNASDAALRQAVSIQRQMVTDYGRGQARLLILLRRLKDEKGAAIELSNLQKLDAHEGEILTAAILLKLRAMDRTNPDVEAKSQAITLLQSYIAANRNREAKSQNQAERLLKELTEIK